MPTKLTSLNLSAIYSRLSPEPNPTSAISFFGDPSKAAEKSTLSSPSWMVCCFFKYLSALLCADVVLPFLRTKLFLAFFSSGLKDDGINSIRSSLFGVKKLKQVAFFPFCQLNKPVFQIQRLSALLLLKISPKENSV